RRFSATTSPARSPWSRPRPDPRSTTTCSRATNSIVLRLKLSQHETLQVVGLGHAQDHRAVADLPALLHDRDRPAGVARGRGQDLLEIGLVDVVGAGAGDEAAAGFEDLERAEVDLLVAPAGFLDGVLALRERGRVEDDRGEALAPVVEVAQQVEDVRV